jgi:mannose-6-phosphate isomerase-like protein (cupin superfamily)
MERLDEGGIEVVDFGALVESGEVGRPVWAGRCDDLNLNFVVLERDERIDDHANSEVDVLMVALSGAGVVTVEGREYELGAGSGMVVLKGMRRSVRAASARFGYLTCHRRRGGLWPAPLQSKVKDER